MVWLLIGLINLVDSFEFLVIEIGLFDGHSQPVNDDVLLEVGDGGFGLLIGYSMIHINYKRIVNQ